MKTFAEVHQHNPYLVLFDYADTLEPFSDERYHLLKNIFGWTYATEVIENPKPEDIHPILHQQNVVRAHTRRNEIVHRLNAVILEHQA